MDDIPASLEEFIRASINSVEQITLLLLLESARGRTWTVSEISAELRSTDASIERRLKDLYAAGVLAPPSGNAREISYVPPSEEMSRMVSALLDAYRRQPNRVIAIIYSSPSPAVRAFADAFNLKRGKP